jgi:hypothetical protein
MEVRKKGSGMTDFERPPLHEMTRELTATAMAELHVSDKGPVEVGEHGFALVDLIEQG